MAALRMKLIVLVCLAASTIFWGRPSFSETASETTISEQTLAGDIVIQETYQPASGLPVGKIQSVRGEAIVFHRDPTVGYRILSGLPLYAGDILRTRAAAWIFCRLIDGSHIVLSPLTSLTILQSNYNPARKSSVSFLKLNHGSARFTLKPLPDLSAYDFKVQTDVAFTLAREGDFVVKTNPQATDIVAFENSRLEVTAMAQPEAVTFLSDFQRAIVAEGNFSPTVETLSRQDIETIQANFYPAAQSTLFAVGTNNNREDHKTDESPTEEDIAEPKLSE